MFVICVSASRWDHRDVLPCVRLWKRSCELAGELYMLWPRWQAAEARRTIAVPVRERELRRTAREDVRHGLDQSTSTPRWRVLYLVAAAAQIHFAGARVIVLARSFWCLASTPRISISLTVHTHHHRGEGRRLNRNIPAGRHPPTEGWFIQRDDGHRHTCRAGAQNLRPKRAKMKTRRVKKRRPLPS